MTDVRRSGQRVKMSADRLRQQGVKLGTDSVMVRCLHDGILVGHAFATRWVVGGKSVCWVTQLCVRAQLGGGAWLLRYVSNLILSGSIVDGSGLPAWPTRAISN